MKAQVSARFTGFRTRFCYGSNSVAEELEDLGFNVAAGRGLYEEIGQLTVIRIDNAAPALCRCYRASI